MSLFGGDLRLISLFWNAVIGFHQTVLRAVSYLGNKQRSSRCHHNTPKPHWKSTVVV
uniref:Uncharacterized protein n=1 Tax=Anguilla anguilla TaxID=7936 RepID=A0A0E9XF65_ANGAN